MRNRRIVIGTRGSQLARAQAAIVAQRLHDACPHLQVETRIIVTSGDRDRNSRLSDIGGKGIFIRELERAIVDGSIDIAVHSFKDVTTRLAPGLTLAAFLQPESVCDVMVTYGNMPFEFLPRGALIGTGSTRRKALLQRLRPDLQIAEIRGNIDTRIAKIDRREYDGVMLSEAGLIRLGLEERVSVRFDPESFFPAPGQGVITLEARESDREIQELCELIGDQHQLFVSVAELELLYAIGFDCRTPLGVYSTIEGGKIKMSGFFVGETTGEFRTGSAEGSSEDPFAVGKRLAAYLLGTGKE